MRSLLLALVLLAVPLAGCFGETPDVVVTGTLDPSDGLYHLNLADTELDVNVPIAWAPGAVSTLINDGSTNLRVEPSEATLIIQDQAGEKRFSLPGSVDLAPGGSLTFIPPPGASGYDIRVAGSLVQLRGDGMAAEDGSWNQVLSGENVVDLQKFQEANFRHREPGGPNYWASIEYFDTYFQDLGYETEVDPYGTHGLTMGNTLCLPVRGTTYCPESVANVVAWKEGATDPDSIIFVAGGHFDMVNGTTHAAFDDTSGTVGTLELARAMAPYTFDKTIMFGLWGGEENGLLGSQFWVQTNPDKRASVVTYWNLDVIAMSWPAPLPRPDPMLIAAGPDTPGDQSGGTSDPVSQSLLAWARELHHGWLAFPEASSATGEPVVIYEGVASGQATGRAGVNAQSDHTPFIAAGIPSYFIFNADALDSPVQLHTESDTLTNMTKYALFEKEFDLDDPTWPSDEMRLAGEAALARSYEATLFFPFYHAVLVDLGVYEPPARPSALVAS